MSTDDWRPKQDVAVPGQPGIRARYIGERTDERSGRCLIWLVYYGTAEALIAVGLATPEVVTPAGPKDKGPRRVGGVILSKVSWPLMDIQPETGSTTGYQDAAQHRYTLPIARAPKSYYKASGGLT